MLADCLEVELDTIWLSSYCHTFSIVEHIASVTTEAVSTNFSVGTALKIHTLTFSTIFVIRGLTVRAVIIDVVDETVRICLALSFEAPDFKQRIPRFTC